MKSLTLLFNHPDNDFSQHHKPIQVYQRNQLSENRKTNKETIFTLEIDFIQNQIKPKLRIH